MNPDDFTGSCNLRVTSGAENPLFEERLLVDVADLRVKIVGSVVREAEKAPPRLNGPPYTERDGDLLRINGDNRTVIYRLVEYLADEDIYLAEWPD